MSLFCGNNIDYLDNTIGFAYAILSLCSKCDNALDERENGVVFAKSHVLTREKFGSSLSDNDLTWLGELSGEKLHAQIFGR